MTRSLRLASQFLCSFLLACAPVASGPGDVGSDPSDAGSVDAGESPDAGAACTDHCRVDENDEAQCACLFNDECGDGYRCGGVSGTCDCGARGTKAYGESCATGDDCASGLCAGEAPNGRCSQRCTMDEDCPTPMIRCFSFLGACSPD